MDKITSGIYIHFPFCKVKCGYCDFYSIINREDSIPVFIDSLIHEIELYFNTCDTSKFSFDSLFMGGGTPSLIQPQYIERIFNTLSKYVDISSLIEITMEANPGEAPRSSLKAYREIGVNRISFGFQSLDDRLLKFLDRIHTSEQCNIAFKDARKAGFDNINTDMIFNIPGQTLDILNDNLNAVIKLGPEHISSYSLTVEKGTMLYNNVLKGKVLMPDEKLDYDMYRKTSDIISENGYKQYETSNFSRESKECIHNLHYWNLDPYISFGPSAHGYDGKRRWWNHRSLDKYISDLKNNILPVNNSETLSKKNQYNEIIMNGLRTSRGVNLNNLNTICKSENLNEIVQKWPQLIIENDYLKLKDDDYMLLDEITSELFI